MLIPPESATQHGCFSYPQAQRVGWNYGLLGSAVGRHQLVVVRRGVWMEAGLWAALDARGQHVARLHADLLQCGPHWHAARRSTAVLLDLPLIGKPPAESQLVADPGNGKRRPMSRHRQVAPLPAAATCLIDGIRSVTGYRAIVDLARTEPFLNGVVVADALLGRGLPRERLLSVVDAMAGWPQAGRAAEVIAFADGLSESALESLSRVRVREHRLPAPELQVEVWLDGEFLGRVDTLWRALGVVGEADGMAKFGATESEREVSFKVMYARARRMEDAGLVVARWDWDDAWKNGGLVLVNRLTNAFARAATQQLDPRLRFVPTTVADRLRRERRFVA